MKNKILLAMGLCAAIGWTINPNASARAEKADAHPDHPAQGEKIEVPGTLGGIWTEIHKHHHELADTVKNHKLSEVHHHAFAIRDLAKGLPAKVPAEHKKHIETMVKKLSQLAADLDKSGDANDQARTEANLVKTDALLKELEDMAGPGDAAPHKH